VIVEQLKQMPAVSWMNRSNLDWDTEADDARYCVMLVVVTSTKSDSHLEVTEGKCLPHGTFLA